MLDTGPVFCHNHEKWSLPTWLAKFRSIGVAVPPWLPTITAGTGVRAQVWGDWWQVRGPLNTKHQTLNRTRMAKYHHCCVHCPAPVSSGENTSALDKEQRRSMENGWWWSDVVYQRVDNQSEEMIHQADRRSDKSVTVAGLTWTADTVQEEEGEGREGREGW